MRNASTVHTFTFFLFIVSFVFLFPNFAHAEIVVYKGDPFDQDTWGQFSNGTPQVSTKDTDGDAVTTYLLAGIRMPLVARSTDESMRFRVRNNSGSTFIDCQTSYFEPTVVLPVATPNSLASFKAVPAQVLTLEFTGADCEQNYGAGNFFIYGELESSPGTQEFNQLYSVQDAIGYSINEISDTAFPPDEPENTTTHFETITPAHLSTTTAPASSEFEIGATGYINQSFVLGTRHSQIYQKVLKQSFTSIFITNIFSTKFTVLYDLGEGYFGPFDVSTTTDFSALEEGSYRLESYIRRPGFLGIVLPSDQVVSITRFTIGEPDPSDQFYDSVADAIVTLGYGDGGVASTTAPHLTCAPSNFDIRACMAYLFIPSSADFQNFYDGYSAMFLQKVPFGYVTRFTAIMTSGAAILPPGIEYEFGTASPQVLQDITDGDPIEFNVFQHFDKIALIETDDGQELNIWEVIDPYFTMIVGFSVLLVILSDTIGLELRGDRTQGSHTNNGNSLGDGKLTRRERSNIKNPQRGDNRGRTASERRRLIAQRGIRHDAKGHGGITH